MKTRFKLAKEPKYCNIKGNTHEAHYDDYSAAIPKLLDFVQHVSCQALRRHHSAHICRNYSVESSVGYLVGPWLVESHGICSSKTEFGAGTMFTEPFGINILCLLSI
jgi:hypothetical protein